MVEWFAATGFLLFTLVCRPRVALSGARVLEGFPVHIKVSPFPYEYQNSSISNCYYVLASPASE